MTNPMVTELHPDQKNAMDMLGTFMAHNQWVRSESYPLSLMTEFVDHWGFHWAFYKFLVARQETINEARRQAGQNQATQAGTGAPAQAGSGPGIREPIGMPESDVRAALDRKGSNP